MARSKVIKRFGSMRFNGQPMDVGAEYHDEAFCFGDTVCQKELRWVDTSSILVADRCICTNISWAQLDDMGYIFGRAVRIDGKPYWCRSLEVGKRPGADSEWDRLLKEFGDSDDRWHWADGYFWGQTIPAETAFPDDPPSRVVRGFVQPSKWWYQGVQEHHSLVGFRPVLEPLESMPPFDTLLGKRLFLYGPQKYPLEGTLVGVDEYDMVLADASSLKSGCSWAVEAKNQQILVRKTDVIWLEVA